MQCFEHCSLQLYSSSDVYLTCWLQVLLWQNIAMHEKTTINVMHFMCCVAGGLVLLLFTLKMHDLCYFCSFYLFFCLYLQWILQMHLKYACIYNEFVIAMYYLLLFTSVSKCWCRICCYLQWIWSRCSALIFKLMQKCMFCVVFYGVFEMCIYF